MASETKDTIRERKLQGFAELIEEQGVEKVMGQMDEMTFWALYKWFGSTYELEYRHAPKG